MTSLHVSKPRPGYYRVKLVKGGPWVPVCILHYHGAGVRARYKRSRPGILFAVVGEQCITDENKVLELWPFVAGNPIEPETYYHMQRLAKWARENDPNAPEANPRKPIDVHTLPPQKI